MTKIKIAVFSIMVLLVVSFSCIGLKSNAFELTPEGNVTSDNMFPLDRLVQYKNLAVSTGQIVDSTAVRWASEAYSYVSGMSNMVFKCNDVFVNQTNHVLRWCFYDSSKAFLNGENRLMTIEPYVVSIPSNAVYVRFGAYMNTKEGVEIMLNSGTTPLPYEAPGLWYNSSYVKEQNERIDSLENELDVVYGQKTDLQNQYNALQSQYESLQNQYTALEQRIANFQEFSQYGWGAYIYDIEVVTEEIITYTKESLLRQNYLRPSGTLYLFGMADTNNNRYGPVTMTISFDQTQAPPANGFPATLLNIAASGGPTDLSITISDDDGNNKTISLTNENVINYQSLYPEIKGALIENIVIYGSSPDAFSSISMIGDSNKLYDSGYSAGKNDGYNSGRESGLKDGEKIGYDKGYEVGYNKGVEQDVASSGFTTLFNSILSYPVNMVKTVFNFEFMGINVASLVMFIISIGIVAFVLKHFL